MATIGEIRGLGFEDLGILKDLMRKEDFFFFWWGRLMMQGAERLKKPKN